ncbi:MAG: hypothetical protein JWO05_1028 [Gemmatimonadetes bacterium]|nr:hypothetical protein [Gemmatimonadota bacterium]
MRHLLSNRDRTFSYARVGASEEVPALLVPQGTFGCLLWDSAGDWSIEQREALVSHLIQSGCRTLACGGHDCEVWHDLADETLAFLNATQWRTAEQEVMTTWHTEETAQEVVFFVTTTAEVEEPSFGEYLILEVGPAPHFAGELTDALKRYGGEASDTAAD